jgi:hypothetical protein
MATLQLDWGDKEISDARLALLMLRQDSRTAERRVRLTKMIDDIELYRGAVAAVEPEQKAS